MNAGWPPQITCQIRVASAKIALTKAGQPGVAQLIAVPIFSYVKNKGILHDLRYDRSRWLLLISLQRGNIFCSLRPPVKDGGSLGPGRGCGLFRFEISYLG